MGAPRGDGSGMMDLVSDGDVLDGGKSSITDEAKDILADKIADSDFFSESADDEAEDVVVDPADEELEDDASAEDEAEGADDEAEGADEDEAEGEGEDEDGGEDGGEAKVSVVPDAQRRSMKAMGWADADIDSLAETNPDLAMRTAERIHGSRVTQLNEFARLGRIAAAAEDGAEDGGPDGRTPSEAAEALIEEHGEENAELITKLAAPLQVLYAKVQALLPAVERGSERAAAAENAALQTQIGAFFESEPLKPFVAFYGDAAKGRTVVELERFEGVLLQADAIIAGAISQDRDVSVEDALLAAHFGISADYQAEAAVEGVRTKVKKRAKSTTLRPTNRGKKKAAGRGRATTEAEAVRNVRAGLEAAFS